MILNINTHLQRVRHLRAPMNHGLFSFAACINCGITDGPCTLWIKPRSNRRNLQFFMCGHGVRYPQTATPLKCMLPLQCRYAHTRPTACTAPGAGGPHDPPPPHSVVLFVISVSIIPFSLPPTVAPLPFRPIVAAKPVRPAHTASRYCCMRLCFWDSHAHGCFYSLSLLLYHCILNGCPDRVLQRPRGTLLAGRQNVHHATRHFSKKRKCRHSETRTHTNTSTHISHDPRTCKHVRFTPLRHHLQKHADDRAVSMESTPKLEVKKCVTPQASILWHIPASFALGSGDDPHPIPPHLPDRRLISADTLGF